MKEKSAFAALLVELRGPVSQAASATRAGVSLRAWQLWESGRYRPGRPALIRLRERYPDRVAELDRAWAAGASES